ncbi:hypothetical protein AB0M29_34575 [Streptomyces sp. NPDC051976]|uniref:hypothetical protein n=1 Tax=Streptomyces sp. NPDC051976 TaxID=3154947 RepID=UPI00342A7A05
MIFTEDEEGWGMRAFPLGVDVVIHTEPEGPRLFKTPQPRPEASTASSRRAAVPLTVTESVAAVWPIKSDGILATRAGNVTNDDQNPLTNAAMNIAPGNSGNLALRGRGHRHRLQERPVGHRPQPPHRGRGS